MWIRAEISNTIFWSVSWILSTLLESFSRPTLTLVVPIYNTGPGPTFKNVGFIQWTQQTSIFFIIMQCCIDPYEYFEHLYGITLCDRLYSFFVVILASQIKCHSNANKEELLVNFALHCPCPPRSSTTRRPRRRSLPGASPGPTSSWTPWRPWRERCHPGKRGIIAIGITLFLRCNPNYTDVYKINSMHIKYNILMQHIGSIFSSIRSRTVFAVWLWNLTPHLNASPSVRLSLRWRNLVQRGLSGLSLISGFTVLVYIGPIGLLFLVGTRNEVHCMQEMKWLRGKGFNERLGCRLLAHAQIIERQALYALIDCMSKYSISFCNYSRLPTITGSDWKVIY